MNTVMNFTELIHAANLRLSELGLDRLPDGRVADRLVPRNVRFLRQAGVISRPEGRGSGASWGEIHLQQLVTGRAMQANGLSIGQIRDQINGLDLEALREHELKALEQWHAKREPADEIAPCASWQITPDILLVSTRKDGLSKDKLQQIRRILT